jgi:ribosomal protein S18 acetylase RimI-like enzyme
VSEVLVVHCVDTEGPLGGNARRRPDGSPEFMDSWDDILGTLRELTDDRFRRAHADSHGCPYRFNWFCLDFTGFRTNPKQKVTAYHDTYDRLRSLPTEADGFYWHYHVPPPGGAGDEWSARWSSEEGERILARRLVERADFPEAFRAGGTIEDDEASAWLEQLFLLDFSNRVSGRSYPGAPLADFNWHGAPMRWAPYHPSAESFLRPGSMRRLVYRSIDLRSRVNELTQEEVDAVFREVAETGEPRVLSYFSHDCRDMRPETYDAAAMLGGAAERTGAAWRSCTAVEAHRRFHGLGTERVGLVVEPGRIVAEGEPFQPQPFVAVEREDGRIERVLPEPAGGREWTMPSGRYRRYGAAVTSLSGDKTVRLVAPLSPELAGPLGDMFEALGTDEHHFHPHPLTREEAVRRCANGGGDVYASVLEEGRVVGYGMLRGWEAGYEVPSLGIAVHPAARGAGVAQTLMAHLHHAARARGAPRVRLKVYPDNEPARRLYERLGYEFAGEEDGQLVAYLSL